MSRRNRNTPEETPAPAAPATLADDSLEREVELLRRAEQPMDPHPPDNVEMTPEERDRRIAALDAKVAEISRDVAGQPAIMLDAPIEHVMLDSVVTTGDGGHGTAELKPGLPIEEGYPDRDPRTLGDIGGAPGEVTRVPLPEGKVVVNVEGDDPDRFVDELNLALELRRALRSGEGIDAMVDKLCAYRARKFGPRTEVAAWRPSDEVDPCRTLVEQLYDEVKDKIGGHEELLAARLARVLDVHHPARC